MLPAAYTCPHCSTLTPGVLRTRQLALSSAIYFCIQRLTVFPQSILALECFLSRSELTLIRKSPLLFPTTYDHPMTYPVPDGYSYARAPTFISSVHSRLRQPSFFPATSSYCPGNRFRCPKRFPLSFTDNPFSLLKLFFSPQSARR